MPVAEQLKVFQLARPSIKRLGLLFCTATPVAVATGKEAEAAAREMGLEVVKATLTDVGLEQLESALTYLQAAGAEALFLPTDPVMASPKNLKVIQERMLQTIFI